jgi:hypothetical protein
MFPRASRPLPACCLIAAVLLGPLMLAQSADENFRVYTPQPRLFLAPRHLRRLKRDRERQTPRWQQFKTLIDGNAQMPEPGFAYALYYVVTDDAAAGRRAIAWASTPAADLRQTAIVYDWCHPLLTPPEAATLESKLQHAIEQPPAATDIDSVRARVLAAISIADDDRDLSEKVLRWAVLDWWRGHMAPLLNRNPNAIRSGDLYALCEILHAVRDNTVIDLRQDARVYFSGLAARDLLSYYPETYPAAGGEYRIKAFKGSGEPDLKLATLARIAELSMIAYDANSLDSQYLQGWVIPDRLELRTPFGAPYEFLWADPYQPGLSYYQFRLSDYNPETGTLLVRSSWDEGADWLGIVDGQTQYSHDGRITILDPWLKQAPIRIGTSLIVIEPVPLRFHVPAAGITDAFVLGLDAGAKYDVEVDYEDMYETETDAQGTLHIDLPGGTAVGVRIKRGGRKSPDN